MCPNVVFLSLSPSPVVFPPVQVRLAPSSSLALPARPERRRDTPSPQQVPLPLTVVCVSSPNVAVSAVRSRVNSILILHSTEHYSVYCPHTMCSYSSPLMSSYSSMCTLPTYYSIGYVCCVILWFPIRVLCVIEGIPWDLLQL